MIPPKRMELHMSVIHARHGIEILLKSMRHVCHPVRSIIHSVSIYSDIHHREVTNVHFWWWLCQRNLRWSCVELQDHFHGPFSLLDTP